MGKPSKAVEDFREKYGVARDEIWEVHGTTWVVKHKALERVAVEVGIIWDKPELKVCDIAQGFVVCLISGKLGDHVEFSFGEASPKNNKNSYPVAMAEKRAKDRVILKLLTVHGDLYSDVDDIPEPTKRPMPDDDEILKKDEDFQTLTVDAQRPIFSELERELSGCETVDETRRWKVSARSRASRLSSNWRKILDEKYLTHLRAIEKREATDYIERATA